MRGVRIRKSFKGFLIKKIRAFIKKFRKERYKMKRMMLISVVIMLGLFLGLTAQAKPV